MITPHQFIGTPEQVSAVLDMYPDAVSDTITWVNSGAANMVALVDTEEGGRCFRFARTESGKELLAYEHAVLMDIQAHGPLVVPTPEPLWLAPDRSYAVMSRLAGRNMDENELHGLPEEQRRVFGKTMGSFIVGMNDIFLDEGRSVPGMPVSPNDWHDWYTDIHSRPDRSRFGEVFDYFYDLYRRSLTRRRPDRVVIHGDLHPGNVLFGEQGDISGVIDFGEAGMGCIHRELRSVYRTGGRVALEAAVGVLDERFQPIDIETITHQAAVHEMAIVIEWAAKRQLQDNRAMLADASLKRWLGDMWVGLQPA